jgi:hypothetical protein
MFVFILCIARPHPNNNPLSTTTGTTKSVLDLAARRLFEQHLFEQH